MSLFTRRQEAKIRVHLQIQNYNIRRTAQTVESKENLAGPQDVTNECVKRSDIMHCKCFDFKQRSKSYQYKRYLGTGLGASKGRFDVLDDKTKHISQRLRSGTIRIAQRMQCVFRCCNTLFDFYSVNTLCVFLKSFLCHPLRDLRRGLVGIAYFSAEVHCCEV